jgi:hypothetical protein
VTDDKKPPEFLEPGELFPDSKVEGPATVPLKASDLPPKQLPSDDAPSDDAPILPLIADLHEAVGVTPKRRDYDDEGGDERGERDDSDDDEKPHRRRTIVVSAISIMVGLSVIALVFLGRANSQRYVIVCDAAHATAEQGRGFPPWGTHALRGPEWKAIALPTSAECKPRETDDIDQLGKWYLELLVERATTTLTSRTLLDPVAAASGVPAANPLDAVAEELDQALLLARNPDLRDQRKEVERLLGDVDYWRASLRLRDASTVLQDAAKQFDSAAAQRPRHVSDAAAWATHVRKLADELRAGPNAQPTAQFPAAGSAAPAVIAPPGIALPVESGSAASAAPSPAPDAGVPSGGVLL